jgi:hypothetical protein
LVKELNRQNITTIQCVNSIASIQQQDVLVFVVGIYEKCIAADISAEKTIEVCRKIAAMNEPISFMELPELIAKQVEIKRTFESELTTLRGSMEKLRKEYGELVEHSRTEQHRIKVFEDSRSRLRSYGISLADNLEKLANFMENLASGDWKPQ